MIFGQLITEETRFMLQVPMSSDWSSWRKVEDELDSTHIMHVYFNSMSDYAESI